MMTLEEVCENLRQDPEIKATMEEAEKSYRLFKKIENLIVSDLKAKLAKSDMEVFMLTKNNECYKNDIAQLKQQLAEKEKFLERIMSGEYIPANIAEKSLKLSNQTAIDELEKVKDYIREFVGINDVKFICTTTITDQIDKQINSLKGDA